MFINNNTPLPWKRIFSSLIALLMLITLFFSRLEPIYEYILFDGRKHISLASLPGMEDRTVTISGLGKTFAVLFTNQRDNNSTDLSL